MKKYYTILIISLFAIFTSFILYTQDNIRVIKVYSPNTIALDVNKNGKIELNEKFTIDEIETFTSKTSDYQKSLADKMNIDEETALAIGYFAEKYAQSLIEDKNVKYKKLKNNNIKITFNGKNYSKLFNNSPFALSNGKAINEKDFSKQIQLAKNSQLKIYNNKSNKYHRLNCKYGQLAHDAIILPKNQLPKNAKACKFCENTTTVNNKADNTKQEQQKLRNIIAKRFSTNNEYIKVILTDLSTILLPNNKCTSEFCMDLVKEINNSQKTIDMALYGYTNIPEITTSIQNAIKRGVTVRFVHDITSDGNNFYSDTLSFAKTLSKSSTDYGDFTYQNAIMHNKFFIFDDSTVITGSANISPTDISGFNTNDIIIIKSPQIAQLYKQEFEQMYNKKFHNRKSKIENNENILLGSSIVSVYFSPQNNVINTVVIPLINEAKNYIYLPMFVITHKKASQALSNAASRGVDVRIILDATNASNKYTTHETLRKSNVLVKTENFAGKMHSKSIIIDDKYIVTGSMNLSKRGNNINDENVLVIENSTLAKYYKNFFLYLWKKIPNKWLYKNASSESYDSIGSCFDGVDNDFDEKVDMNDSGCFSTKSKK